MRTKGWICSIVKVILLFLCILGKSYAGPGHEVEIVATPYSDKYLLNEINIEKCMRKSNKYRRILKPEIFARTDILEGCNVGLRYEEGLKTLFYFKNINGSPEIINFSRIESIELHEVSGDIAYLNVVIFPTIKIEELFNNKPSYTDLKEKYRRIVKISTYLNRPSLGELMLVCEDDDQFNNKYYHKIESLRNFPPKTIIEFSYEIRKDVPIWWAIKQVIEDESYPYKKWEYTGPPTATSKSPNISNSIQFGN